MILCAFSFILVISLNGTHFNNQNVVCSYSKTLSVTISIMRLPNNCLFLEGIISLYCALKPLLLCFRLSAILARH